MSIKDKFDELAIYQVDAFAEQVFQGNPAAVCPLKEWLSDSVLQSIAEENNLSETAFFVKRANGYHLRWFTPVAEVRLCGHATLASAHVLFNHLGAEEDVLCFHTLSGELRVQRAEEGLLMEFPADIPQAEEDPGYLSTALGVPVLEVRKGKDDLLVRIESEVDLEALQPNFDLIRQLGSRGLIVTTASHSTDFYSRCFFPNLGVDEDPVTGSAHTLLAPYWAAITGKTTFSARQGGKRRGYLQCSYKGNSVFLKGKAQTFLIGKIYYNFE